MLRLALYGSDENAQLELSRRLHRVQLTAAVAQSDAVWVAGSRSPAHLQDVLDAAGARPVLLAPEVLREPELWSAVLRSPPDQPRWVANPDRFLPAVMAMRQSLQAGQLGVPGLLRLHRWQSATTTPPAGQMTAGRSWLRDLDLMCWLMGGVPERVYALRQTPPSAAAAGSLLADLSGLPAGTLQLHCGWKHGGMALLDFSDQLPAGDGYQSLMLIGSSGAAWQDDHQNRQLVLRGGPAQTVLDDTHWPAVAGLLQAFVDHVASAAEWAAAVADWSAVLQLAGLIEQSCRSGQAVAWQHQESHAGDLR